MASRAILDLHPDLQPLCRQFIANCKNAGITAFPICTYRSNDEQNIDYEKGRAAPGPIITNARGGESPHNCTLPDGTPAAKAFDFGIQKVDNSLDWNANDALWQKAIAIGEALGLVSGNTWKQKDSDHMELATWKTI